MPDPPFKKYEPMPNFNCRRDSGILAEMYTFDDDKVKCGVCYMLCKGSHVNLVVMRILPLRIKIVAKNLCDNILKIKNLI